MNMFRVEVGTSGWSHDHSGGLFYPAHSGGRAGPGLVFDIELLANRLIEVTGWLTRFEKWPSQPIGYVGASTVRRQPSALPQTWRRTSHLWCRGADDPTSPDQPSPRRWHPHF